MRKNPTQPGLKQHQGVDIAMPVGTTVRATVSGKVVRARWESKADPKKGFGEYVKIDTGDGRAVTLGHLSEIAVKEGQQVKAGDVIGKSGNTGRTSGPHLHLEERVNGKPVDPLGKK